LLTEKYEFKPSSSEDFTFLHDLQRTHKTIAFSQSIAYYVKEDASYCGEAPAGPRFVINPK